jgi:hypothetical protein
MAFTVQMSSKEADCHSGDGVRKSIDVVACVVFVPASKCGFQVNYLSRGSLSLYALWPDLNAFADVKGHADVTGRVIEAGCSAEECLTHE